MMSHKVSLIIPTYNRYSYLRETLQSVFEQSRKPDEIIVIDDGSNDATPSLLSEFQNITYIHQNNQGVSAARNHGIKISSGDWITFLDSDDLWCKNKLEEQLLAAKKHPLSRIFYTDEIWIRNGKRVNPGKRHKKYTGWIFEQCLPLCTISPSSIMIHRSVLDKVGLFDDHLPVCEDYDLWLRISLHYPVHLIKKNLIMKRGGHSDQLSGKFFGMDRFRIQSLEKILDDPGLKPEQRVLVLNMINEKSVIYAQGCLKRNRLKEYREYIDR